MLHGTRRGLRRLKRADRADDRGAGGEVGERVGREGRGGAHQYGSINGHNYPAIDKLHGLALQAQANWPVRIALRIPRVARGHTLSVDSSAGSSSAHIFHP